MTPGARTRLCALLGSPVSHSLSPAIHNAALARDGLYAVYTAFDVRADDLPEAVSGLRALGAVGANVTIPHKEAVLSLADAATDTATQVGAANTLCFRSGTVTADNTDVEGVTAALSELGLEGQGVPWLVMGAGGSARAVAWAALVSGSGSVLIANRTPERGVGLTEEIIRAGGDARSVAWADRGDAAASAALIVHATSIGLDGDESPLDASDLHRAVIGGCRGVLDLVYRTGETRLVRDAREAGLVASDGLEVLVSQAAASYRLWWGVEPPVEVMRAASREALGRDAAAGPQGRLPLL